MRRFLQLLALCLFTIPVLAQVQTVGDVSFAVPDGWTYKAGNGFGAMAHQEGDRFWAFAVYSSMPSSGDSNADFKAAWTRILLAGPDYKGVPEYSPYSTSQEIGYQGKYYDGSSVNQSTYTRLYILQAGNRWIPVAEICPNRGVMDAMEHMAKAIVGSVRLAPLKAVPIKTTISTADLAGFWKSGLVTSIDYYNSSGQYKSNSLTAVNWGYTIAADGSYTYKFSGLMNNRPTNDDDTGVVELGDGFLTFKGQRRVNRHRFVFMTQALDGSSVLALFPALEMSQINSTRDITFYTRPVKK